MQAQPPESGLVALASPVAANPFRQGTVIGGKYEVMGLIGDGGMGFVLAAKHLELGEVVALKFLRPEALRNPEVVARFAREARASARIKSEYVARVFDVGSLPDGVPFIVMEHLEGEDLSSVLEKRGALPARLAVEYVMQVCEALAAAHSIGIVHRDIKPENLFLAHRSQGMDIVKVLDFGISKVALTGSAFDTNLPLVRTMLPMGSPVYMSPEQIRAQDIDPRSDIWSLGCVLYELLTGATAFDAPSITQLSAIILEKNPTPIRHLLPDAPPELEQVVNKCLQKNPDDRFQSIADLAIALYPFAPRRARISAERCSYMLHGTALSAADFELISVPPPAGSDSQSLSLASGPQPIGRRTSGAFGRLTNPTELSTIEVEEIRPAAGKRRLLIYAVLGLVLAAGAYGASRMRAKSETAERAAVTTGAQAPAKSAPKGASPTLARPAQPATAGTNAAQPAIGSGPASHAAASASAASSGRESASRAPSSRRSAVGVTSLRRSAVRSGGRHNEEVDVGF